MNAERAWFVVTVALIAAVAAALLMISPSAAVHVDAVRLESVPVCVDGGADAGGVCRSARGLHSAPVSGVAR